MNVDQQGESTTVDWQQYESDAHQAIAAASTAGELDDARVHYLGRKGDLAQALRAVRDRESGMLLNGIRARLESVVDARRAAIENAFALVARSANTRLEEAGNSNAGPPRSTLDSLDR